MIYLRIGVWALVLGFTNSIDFVSTQKHTHIFTGVKASLPAGMVGFVARETVLPPELADAAPAAAAQRYVARRAGSW